MSLDIAVSVLMVGASFIFGYIAMNLDKKHSIIGWFFLLLSFAPLMTAPFLIAETTSTVSVQNILYSFSYLIIIAFSFSLLYLFLFIITKGFEKLINSSRNNDKNKYSNKLG